MGIFDSAREQAEKLSEEHGGKIEQPSDEVLDRMAGEAGERTGGSHDEHIDSARDLADRHIGTDDVVDPGVPPAPVDPPAES